MFSRFMFYIYGGLRKWDDVSPNTSGWNLTTHFKELAEKVDELIQYTIDHPTEVLLSQSQWNKINDFGRRSLRKCQLFQEGDAGSIPIRLGLMLFRILMVLTTIRKYEQIITEKRIECNNDDFDLALKIIETSFQHSLVVFENLPKSTNKKIFESTDWKEKFYSNLPKEFKRKEAITIGLQLDRKNRQIDKILSTLLKNGALIKIGTGVYRKVEINANNLNQQVSAV